MTSWLQQDLMFYTNFGQAMSTTSKTRGFISHSTPFSLNSVDGLDHDEVDVNPDQVDYRKKENNCDELIKKHMSR